MKEISGLKIDGKQVYENDVYLCSRTGPYLFVPQREFRQVRRKEVPWALSLRDNCFRYSSTSWRGFKYLGNLSKDLKMLSDRLEKLV